METSKTEKNFIFFLLIIVLALTIGIFYPFLSVFIVSASFTVLINPIYLWIKKHITKNKSGVASFITVILFLAVLCIPLYFISTIIFNQAQNAYYFVSQNGNTNVLIQRIDGSINEFLPDGFTFNTYEKISNFASFLSNNIGSLFTSTFNTLLMLLLGIFTMFHLLKNGEEWKKVLIKLSPLSEENVKQLLTDLSNSINRILRGSIFIAIVQGILSWIGLWIFGVPNPALWGVLAGITSLVPNLGTSLITVPAILFLYFTGMHLHALGLLLWAGVIIGLVDNILSPYIISKDTDIPSIFVLFSILGGISFMGPIGILLGPLTLSLLYSLVSIYRKETKK